MSKTTEPTRKIKSREQRFISGLQNSPYSIEKSTVVDYFSLNLVALRIRPWARVLSVGLGDKYLVKAGLMDGEFDASENLCWRCSSTTRFEIIIAVCQRLEVNLTCVKENVDTYMTSGLTAGCRCS